MLNFTEDKRMYICYIFLITSLENDIQRIENEVPVLGVLKKQVHS